jgi:hypothetical protein
LDQFGRDSIYGWDALRLLRDQAQRVFLFGRKQIKKNYAYVHIGGYNHPLHALIKKWRSFFSVFFSVLVIRSLIFLWLSLVRSLTEQKKKIFFCRILFFFVSSNPFDQSLSCVENQKKFDILVLLRRSSNLVSTR